MSDRISIESQVALYGQLLAAGALDRIAKPGSQHRAAVSEIARHLRRTLDAVRKRAAQVEAWVEEDEREGGSR